MKIIETKLKGCFLIEPIIYEDHRGCFFESFNYKDFCKAIGQKVEFVQDNEAFSNRGVLRGLHFQMGEFAQAKLVRVIKGKVQDVVVDLRKNSDTFGEHFSIVLSGENKKQLFVPRGFAHGYAVLEDNTIFAYKCDNYYNKEAELGVIYNDIELNIDWNLKNSGIKLSEKDMNLRTLKDFYKIIT